MIWEAVALTWARAGECLRLWPCVTVTQGLLRKEENETQPRATGAASLLRGDG